MRDRFMPLTSEHVLIYLAEPLEITAAFQLSQKMQHIVALETGAHQQTRWLDDRLTCFYCCFLMGQFPILYAMCCAIHTISPCVRPFVVIWNGCLPCCFQRAKPRSSSEQVGSLLSLCLIQFELDSHLMCMRCKHNPLWYSPWRGRYSN